LDSPPRLRLIQGGLSLPPEELKPGGIEAELRRRHAAAASAWLRHEAAAPRSRSHLVVI